MEIQLLAVATVLHHDGETLIPSNMYSTNGILFELGMCSAPPE